MQIIPLPAGTVLWIKGDDNRRPVFWIESYPGNDLRPTADWAVDGQGTRHRLGDDIRLTAGTTALIDHRLKSIDGHMDSISTTLADMLAVMPRG